jgi:hypothetical protein
MICVDFGNPGVRRMYLTYKLETGVVSQWSMVRGASDIIDTRPDDGQKVNSLIRRSLASSVVVLFAWLFLGLRIRASSSFARKFVTVLCIVFSIVSIGIALQEALRFVYTILLASLEAGV